VKLVKSKVQQCKLVREGHPKFDSDKPVEGMKEARQKAERYLEGKR